MWQNQTFFRYLSEISEKQIILKKVKFQQNVEYVFLTRSKDRGKIYLLQNC